jgi:phospholipid/cholesterol/gamma-HCH transport system ATP-binding protein
MVDLAEHVNDYPTDLSTGHKRAVAIARHWPRSRSASSTMNRPQWSIPIMSDHLANLMLRLKNKHSFVSPQW